MTIPKTLFAAIITLVVACDKTSDTISQSTWTINGTTYKEGSSPSYWDNAGRNLTATDNIQNGDIEIIFSSKPTTGTYNLSYNDTCGICGARCRIDVYVGSVLYSNLRSAGATVSVTTGNGGKLTATFSGIPMTRSATLSGTIIER